MKVLLIGSGGREHALAARMLKDPDVSEVIIYPGNPGMKRTLKVRVMASSNVVFEEALSIAHLEKISLVVIGPEWPLFQGWVDRFAKEGIPAFGPNQAAAFLEESKIRSKNFMKENQIPTADFEVTKTLDETIAVIRAKSSWDGYVLKLSGPALGKGVVVTRSAVDAVKVAEDFFKFRPPGIEDGLVVEELIDGKEVSLFYVCMGEQYQFLTSACDHKRLLDQDQGPNTGGMGAYSPANWVSAAILKSAEAEFVLPTLRAMNKQGTPFSGVLFLGLMIRDGKSYLLEYNTRFGDPETQTILPRIEGNFTALLLASARNDASAFNKIKLTESHQHSMHIVKAAKGYPGLFGDKIESGKIIQGVETSRIISSSDTLSAPEQIYFAGVKEENGKLVSSGGRVLGLTVLSDSIAGVQALAYEKIAEISFEGEQYRKDIGAKR